MKTLIVIPAFNEAESLEMVVRNIHKYADFADYIVIDDCSTDRTKEICQKNNYNYLSLPINLGIGGSVQAGYKYALEHSYDIVVQHDGDGQHDPGCIKDVILPIMNGECDITIGSRFLQEGGFKSSKSRRFGIFFLSKLIKICCGNGGGVKDVTSGFRAVNKRFIKFYSYNYPQDYPEPEAIISATLEGAMIKEIPVAMKEREAGQSSINLKRSIYYMIKVSIAILVYRMTHKKVKQMIEKR